jgi:hypothetical protein
MRLSLALRRSWIAPLAAVILAGFSGGANPAPEDIFQNPESLVRGLYAAVSFDPGPGPNWEYVKTFFLPQAVIAVRKTPTSMAVMNVQEFVDWFAADEETNHKLKLTTLRNMAQVFVVYKARMRTPATSPGQIGLDSWELQNKDGRWWVVAANNDVPTPQAPLPEDLR